MGGRGRHRLIINDNLTPPSTPIGGLRLVELGEDKRGAHRPEAVETKHAAWWWSQLFTAVVILPRGRHRAGRGTSRGA